MALQRVNVASGQGEVSLVLPAATIQIRSYITNKNNTSLREWKIYIFLHRLHHALWPLSCFVRRLDRYRRRQLHRTNFQIAESLSSEMIKDFHLSTCSILPLIHIHRTAASSRASRHKRSSRRDVLQVFYRKASSIPISSPRLAYDIFS